MRRTKTYRVARIVGQYVVFPLMLAVIIGGLLGALMLVVRALGILIGWW